MTDPCKDRLAKSPDRQTLQKQLTDPALAFSAALYKVVAEGQSGNLALSPFSVNSALAMTIAGARGDTAKELAQAMRLPEPPGADWHGLMAWLTASLTCPAAHRSRQLVLANALFIQKGKDIKPAFTDLLKSYYDATPGEVDFAKDAPGAGRTINDWVERATRGKIKDLIKPRMLTPDARVVLVDAVYLADKWAVEFPETKDGPFHRTPAATITVPMMRREGGSMDMAYGKMPGFRAVSLRTMDHRTSMILLVPDDVDGLGGVERALDGPLLQKTIDGLKMSKVNLTMPKFKITSELSLKDALGRLGIERLFDPKRADLGAIDGGQDQLYIAAAVHKAYLDVNEKGFEAAAATAMMGFAGAAMPPPTPPVDVVVDRPFLYVIIDNGTRAALFMGRVADPSAS